MSVKQISAANMRIDITDLVLCKPLQGVQLVEAQCEKWRMAKIGEKRGTEKEENKLSPSLSLLFFLITVLSYCALTK